MRSKFLGGFAKKQMFVIFIPGGNIEGGNFSEGSFLVWGKGKVELGGKKQCVVISF